MENVAQSKKPEKYDTKENVIEPDLKKTNEEIIHEDKKRNTENKTSENNEVGTVLQGTSQTVLNDHQDESRKSQPEHLEIRFQMEKLNRNTFACLNSLIKHIPSIGTDFDICRKLGEGSFSVVYLISVKPSAVHKFPGHFPLMFAMKYFTPKVSRKSITNEIELLKHVGGGDNVVSMYSYMCYGMCSVLLLQYMPNDNFKEIIVDMSIEECRIYLNNLFIALRTIHSKGVIHRDIKPSNFLYNRKVGKCLLVDFGLSEFVNSDFKKNALVGTRGFQAPEILINSVNQTTAIDMWSAGVIMMCILSKTYPSFFQSRDCGVYELMSVFGTENISSLARSYGIILKYSENRPPLDLHILCEHLRLRRDNGKTFPQQAPSQMCANCRNGIDEELGGCPRLKPGTIETDIPPVAYDLLGKLLDICPATRITAQQALDHPFIKGKF